MDKSKFSIPCTGDVCAGDTVLFSEPVYSGSWRKPKYEGDRWIAAKVTKDSYGAAKQQHTFTLSIVASEGVEPLKAGARTTRKGRNVYRNGTMREPWGDESERVAALAEKHDRGDKARRVRNIRKQDR